MQCKVAAIVALTLSLQLFSPVKAEDVAGSDANKPKADSRVVARSYMSHLPQRIAGVVVGTLIGTPIALVRCTRRELVKQTKEAYDLGGVPKPVGYLSAGLFGIPSGILCGAWYGAANGIADTLVPENEPFTPATFSLEKMAF